MVIFKLKLSDLARKRILQTHWHMLSVIKIFANTFFKKIKKSCWLHKHLIPCIPKTKRLRGYVCIKKSFCG